MSGFPFVNVGQDLTFLPPYYTQDANGQPVLQPHIFLQQNIPEFQNNPHVGVFIDEFDQNRVLSPSAGGTKIRKRKGPDGAPTKFRRTRSGCYTCRNRRVKCDEGRPICERCRKGKRDCVYPEPKSNSKGKKKVTKEGDAQEEPETQDGNESSGESVDHIDEEEPFSATSELPESPLELRAVRTGSEAASLSDSPTLVDSDLHQKIPRSAFATPRERSMTLGMTDLPDDLKVLLQFARDHITHWHYNTPIDGENFIHEVLFPSALSYKPLLYALCCFAALHKNIKEGGDISDFLKCHTRSLKLLQDSIKEMRKHNLLTLLTILQLAIIEETLGDWVNLKFHRTAAWRIITSLHTPETICQTSMGRWALKLYSHFDTFVGVLGGENPLITREWMEAVGDFDRYDHEQNPEDLIKTYEHCISITRLLSFDTFQFFTDVGLGNLPATEFDDKVDSLLARYDNWESTFPARLCNPENLLTQIPGAPYDPDDPNDPYRPGPIFIGPNYATNIFRVSILCARNVFESRVANLRGQPRPEESSAKLVSAIFSVVNAIRFWEGAPTGSFLNFRAVWSLGTFIHPPTGARNIAWARDTYAEFEKNGYIWPRSIRQRLEPLWMVDLSKWWLPNEDPPPMIKSVREFIDERVAVISADDQSDNLRELRGIFAALNLSEASSPESIQSPGSIAANYGQRRTSTGDGINETN